MGAGKVAPAALIVSAEAARDPAAANNTIQNICLFINSSPFFYQGQLVLPLTVQEARISACFRATCTGRRSRWCCRAFGRDRCQYTRDSVSDTRIGRSG